MPDNPNAGSSDPNARRIVAYGLRNPFRFTIRPGTNDIYIGDVGWSTWEEINRLPSSAAPVENFGWPCYEGAGRQGSYDNLNLNICENLYAAGAGAVTAPLYTYNHSAKVSTETCPTGGSSLSGMAFYNGGTFPSHVQRRAVLLGLLAELHLGDVPGRERGPEPGDTAAVRQRRRRPGGHPGRPRRRPLLR